MNGGKKQNTIGKRQLVIEKGKFAGVFRCDSRSRSMDIFAGFSEDGIHWNIEETPIVFEGAEEEILKREYRYDPRVCFIEDRSTLPGAMVIMVRRSALGTRLISGIFTSWKMRFCLITGMEDCEVPHKTVSAVTIEII